MLDSRCKVRRKTFVIFCALVLAVSNRSTAQSADSAASASGKPWGTWSAKNASGAVFMGTWTASPDSTGRSVTGMWTLSDAQSKTIASGGWSAAKSPTGWNGAWRAVVTGSVAQYSGTWTSSVDLKGDTKFADLFERAAQTIVSGAWQYGAQSGGWSIRAAKRDGSP